MWEWEKWENHTYGPKWRWSYPGSIVIHWAKSCAHVRSESIKSILHHFWHNWRWGLLGSHFTDTPKEERVKLALIVVTVLTSSVGPHSSTLYRSVKIWAFMRDLRHCSVAFWILGVPTTVWTVSYSALKFRVWPRFYIMASWWKTCPN